MTNRGVTISKGPDTAPSDRSESPTGPPKRRGRRKIFYLVDSLSVGGTEVQAVELARRVANAGESVTLGCLRAQGPLLDRLKESGVTIREFHPTGGIDSLGGMYQLLRLSAFLRRERFDVVHTHDLWSNLMGVPAARLAGVPAIVSSRRDLGHLDWYQGKRRVWLRRIQNLSGAVLANATPIRDALIAEDGFAPEKLRVIHNGIDIEVFRRTKRDRETLFPGLGPGKLIVLVGNMHSDVKGHRWLITSSPEVLRRFPTTRFVLVGDGVQRDAFAKQAAELGVRDNFLFLGRRSDVPQILANCDLAVLPSKAEGLPNAVLEYMAAGLPVVASQVGGNSELIDNGVTGWLVSPETPETLSDALLRLLDDPARATEMGHKGRQFVAEHFSFEKLLGEVDALYTELLQRSRSRK